MIKQTVYQYGKKVYKRMPEGAKKRFHKASQKALYSHHTTNIPVVGQSKESIRDWVAAHKRPVSIVIPSYNDYPLLKACIESIHETCAHLDYEIIVSDDYCQPENRELLKTLESDRVKVVFREERGGFAKNVNTGMKHAKHDILLLNSDIITLPDWLDVLQYSAYAIDEKIGMVSPKLVYPDGRIQYGGTYHARVIAPQWFGHKYVGRAANDIQTCVPGYNRTISGACVYIRREVYDELGGLDENFWLGFEDVDYGLQAWAKNYRCYYNPTSILIHYESATRGYSQGKRELASMRYFWRRWDKLFINRPSLISSKGSLKIDYVLSDASSDLWRTYIERQVSQMRQLGHDAALHITEVGGVDELLLDTISTHESLKVACDYGVADTVWLSALEQGRATYLLPDIESTQFPHDRSQQVKVVAGYQPEFNYVAPNRWAANQLQAETAWESSARVVPALDLTGKQMSRKNLIMTFDLDDESRSVVETQADVNGLKVEHYTTTDISVERLEKLRQLAPMFVVQGKVFTNSFVSLALMSLGGVLLSPMEDKARYEVLDGYNSLSFKDHAQIAKAIGDLYDDSVNRAEIAANAQETVASYAARSVHDTEAAFLAIAGSHL